MLYSTLETTAASLNFHSFGAKFESGAKCESGAKFEMLHL